MNCLIFRTLIAQVINRYPSAVISGGSYLVASIALINSVLMVRKYGLEERGGFAIDLLFVSMVGGVCAAYYEGARPGQNFSAVNRLFLVLIATLVFFGVGKVFNSFSGYFGFYVFALVLQVYIAFYIVDLLYVSVLIVSFVKCFQALLLLIFNFLNVANFFGIDQFIGELFFNFVAANFCTLWLVLVVGFVFGYARGAPNKIHAKSVGLMFMTRPVFTGADKFVLSTLLDEAALGAYVTISNVIGIGSPVVNAVVQLSYHGVIKRINFKKFLTGLVASLMSGVLLVPVLDYLFYEETLSSYYYLSLLGAGVLFCLQLIKYIENNRSKRSRMWGYLAAKSIFLLIVFFFPFRSSLLYLILVVIFIAFLILVNIYADCCKQKT